MDNRDKLDRHMNDFAKRSFRDIADGDYIAARVACRAHLFPQFLWSAQQAIEKYVKYILLVNRIPAKKVRHDISAALRLAETLAFKPVFRESSRKFIDHISMYGEYRYLDVSYYVVGHTLLQLDTVVWELRRYCQVLDVGEKELPEAEKRLLAKAHADLKSSDSRPPHLFKLHGGFLEKILDDKKHPARAPLVWDNLFYNDRKRSRIKVRDNFHAANSPLFLFPEMLDELLKYIFIPVSLQEGWRALRAKSGNDLSGAP